MKRVSRGRISILALALALGTAAAQQEGEKEYEKEKEKEKEKEEIHVCTDKTGEIVYQSYPCPEEPRKPRSQPAPVKPEAQPAAPAKAKAKPSVKPAPPGPSPGAAHRPPAAWRLVGPPSVDRVPSAPRPTVGPVDPRFASPERTWQTFSTAMRDGDRVAARACLTSTALRDLGPLIDSSTPEKLSEFVGGAARVNLEGDVGPFWSLRISRARERPKWIFLVRTEGGEWKIAEI